MSWKTLIVAWAAFGLCGLAACKDDAPAGMQTVALQGLPGLSAHLPEGTKVSQNAAGTGVMLKGPGVSTTVSPANEDDPVTLDDAKQKAKSYAASALEEETLSDGYILTYESDGSTGTTYWLVGRRRLEYTSYTCGVSSPKKEHQQSAIAICKSLAK